MRHAAPLLLLILATASCRRNAADDADAAMPGQAPQPVEVMEITTMDLVESIGLVGSIAANESAEIRSEIPGILTEILFDEGSKVEQGQPLVRLDTRELEAQLEEAKARFALAERNLERNRSLLDSNAVSRLEFDAAEAEYAQLQASIHLLEVRLAKSVVIAPFDGFAGSRTLSVGDYVSPENIVTTVDDISRLKVEIEVPERYLPNLQIGTGFTLSTATAPLESTVQGEVYFVSPRVNETTRSAQVKGYVIDPPPFVKPGMFASVTLILRSVDDALVVPETAVLNTERGSVLIVPEPSADGGPPLAAFVPVVTGIRVPGWVQVSAVGPPIAAGDRIVSSGVGGLILFPGIPLQPVEPLVRPGLPAATDRNLGE